MITVAAAGDIHLGKESAGRYRSAIEDVAERADLFLLAGDLTTRGELEEAEICAEELSGLGIPTIAVLGNHDHHCDQQDRVAGMLGEAGIRVLEGDAEVLEINGCRVGIAGTKGFGGGFAGACGSDFGEREMKDFVRHTQSRAEQLEHALRSTEADIKIALMHYSPVRDTLHGEPLEIYPFLGSYLLAEAVDRAGAHLIVHGHAHAGTEKGITPSGIPVRNAALNVIKHAYALYTLGAREPVAEVADRVALKARAATP